MTTSQLQEYILSELKNAEEERRTRAQAAFLRMTPEQRQEAWGVEPGLSFPDYWDANKDCRRKHEEALDYIEELFGAKPAGAVESVLAAIGS